MSSTKTARYPQQRASANRGEWSEVYVFFHLLGDPCLLPCDENLIPHDDGIPLPITAIQRGLDNEKRPLLYTYMGDESRIWRMKAGEQELDSPIHADDGRGEAEKLLNTLLLSTKRDGTSSSSGLVCPDADSFLLKLGNASRKAASESKEDIILTLDDIRAGRSKKPECGFSIKSYLGGAPSLLNSSKDNTNILFRVEGIPASDMARLNSLKIGKLLAALTELGGTLHFEKLCGAQLEENLLLIDTCMPQLLGELLKIHYVDKIPDIKAATERMAELNPQHLPRTDVYEYKVKKMLEAVSLGMTPAKCWKGTENANGGFIIVTPDGQIVSYHLYDRNVFLEYVYRSTFFEHPSTTRHQYGQLFCDDNGMYIKLALQIRFKDRTPMRVRRAASVSEVS